MDQSRKTKCFEYKGTEDIVHWISLHINIETHILLTVNSPGNDFNNGISYLNCSNASRNKIEK